MRSQESVCALRFFWVNWEDVFCVLHMCWTEASSLRFSVVFALSADIEELSASHLNCKQLSVAFILPPPFLLPFICPYLFEKWKSSRKWRMQTHPVNDGWWVLSGLDYSRMVKAGSAGLSGHPQVAMATGPKRWITRRDRQTGNWTDCNWQTRADKGKGGKMVYGK